MIEVKRTERGWAGHFCCSYDCRFRRNTLLEYNGVGIVVSTVGNMIRNGVPEEIGLGRDYETMAFYVDPESGDYKDADTTYEKQIFFNSNWQLKNNGDDDFIDNKANDMHETVVKELSKKLLRGELK